MNQTESELLQKRFRSQYLQHSDLPEHLQEQTQLLHDIERFLIEKDACDISSKVAELDFEILRYAITHLGRAIKEAAMLDSVKLVVESVFETTDKVAINNWESWLTHASCWPSLAKANWSGILMRASEMVIQRLEAVGVPIKGEGAAPIERGVMRLKIEDLVPAEVLEKVFQTREER